ncbi:hypothetical protein NBRC116601_03570 [Cognatishimia sp. WU-CL00825]|uniref:MupA/Atu3671 family FMN-dependent luciferase-like monooxygenase n=1 Tax=Cognatishimia sp. WU-CL00825 TaxID=3127658 RepID=UPI00310906CB
MSLLSKSANASQTAVLIGNESLLVQCAEIWMSSGHKIAQIVTRNSEISDWAKVKDIPVTLHLGPLKFVEITRGFDWLLSIANLQIIPQDMLDLAQRGAVNFHDGPLPKFAGLNAPVWARIAGQTWHGVTWHMIEGDVDTGDILVQREFEITERDTALTLNTKCFSAAIDSFPDVVTALEAEKLPRQPQDLAGRDYYGLDMRPEAAARLDFRKAAKDLVALVHGLDHGGYFNPLCCPKIAVQGQIFATGFAEIINRNGTPGQVLAVEENHLTVATQTNAVRLGGFTDLNGKAVSLNTLVEEGQTLPSLENTAGLTVAMQAVAKHDNFWRKWLSDFMPTKLPLIAPHREQADWSALPVATPAELTEQACIAAIGLLAKSSGAENSVQLALVQPGQSKAVGYINPWVPIGFDLSPEKMVSELVDQVQHTCELLRRKDSFALDIIARDNNLSSLETPDIAIISDQDAMPLEDAAMNFVLNDGKLRLRYDRNRLEETHAARLVARFELILSQMSGATGVISDLQVLPEDERRAVLSMWRNDQNDPLPDQSIHAAISEQAKKTPDATAVVFEHQKLTYAELETRANQTAQVLVQMGVSKGDIVGVHCKRSLDLIIACLAILKSGAVYLPLDPGFPADRLAIYVQDSAAKHIISQSSIADTLPASDAQILLIDVDPSITQASENDLEAGVNGQDLAYLIFTSGSTGRPKGVMVEHRNVANFFAAMDEVIPHCEQATWMAVTSLSFDISVLELFYTLSRGFKLVLSGDESATQISDGPVGTSEQGMEFSLYYWGNDDVSGANKYDLLLEGAKFADENGFCAVWTPERHFHAFGGPYPNPSVTGAAVAAVTKNIGVRAGSCVAPLHHTARIAEEWAVIDNLTNGQAGLAIASGWQPDDFVLRPENTPPNNKPAMFQQIADLRKLWKGEAVEFARQDGGMFAAVTQPRPISAQPEIWVTTAGNPETWKDAGRNGCHVLTHLLGQSIEEVGEKIKLYKAALRDAGHDPADFKITLMLHTFVGADREVAREMAREPMKDYLRAAAGLIKQYAWAFPAFKKPKGVNNPFELDLGILSDEELDSILEFAFMRYFEDSGMFGTIDDCVQRAEDLKKIGVTEIACLIDYGIANSDVLEGLKPLAQVVKAANQTGGVAENDVSIAAQVLRHKVTHMQCTPSMARMLTLNEEATTALSQIKHLFLGGEALSGGLVQDLNACTSAQITNMYGPTETTVWSTTAPANVVPGTVQIGGPVANTVLYILDADMQPVALGVSGELYIGGAGVTRGYWKQEALTADRFVQSPFGDGERLYRTGDLVRARLDGGLDFLSRADHQVKLRGYRIELGEIENLISKFNNVSQAVVIAREDARGDPRLVAYIQGDADEAKLKAYLAATLPDYMIPSHFEMLEALPLTPNKKVDRNALPAPKKRALPLNVAPQDAPQTTVAQGIAEVWSRILGVQNISTSDNFFDLGGHSLLAVQAHREMRETLGHKQLSITDIFRFPTLASLAGRVEKLTGAQAAPDQTNLNKNAATPAETDRAQSRQDAMSKRRAMRARRREKLS